ncbi:MAG TPA: hypothetical protein VGI85_10565 [Chthoniobacterales bacterium]
MENLITNPHHSTYQLLIESEEKGRNVFESLAYLLLIAALSVAMWQFSHQPVTFTGFSTAVESTWTAEGSLAG